MCEKQAKKKMCAGTFSPATGSVNGAPGVAYRNGWAEISVSWRKRCIYWPLAPALQWQSVSTCSSRLTPGTFVPSLNPELSADSSPPPLTHFQQKHYNIQALQPLQITVHTEHSVEVDRAEVRIQGGGGASRELLPSLIFLLCKT